MNKKVLYTGGTFDLFHAGHVNFLRTCKKISDYVVVSLNSDSFIKKYKNKSPIISYEDRKSVLMACRYVDEVVENIGGSDSKPAISKVRPNIIAVGTDWANKDYYSQMNFDQKWLDNNNIVLIYIPYTDHISSTIIRKKI